MANLNKKRYFKIIINKGEKVVVAVNLPYFVLFVKQIIKSYGTICIIEVVDS
jgi:hypothetical protein